MDIELEDIKKWYADKTNKTVTCFDEYDSFVCKVAYDYACEKLVKSNSVLGDVNESAKTCHDPTHSCYPSNYIDGKPNCSNCKDFR